MFIVGLFGWWYGDGWRLRGRLIRERIIRAFDQFSIDLLIKTWFSPFRQISAGSVRGPIGVQLRAWFDRLISRLIGGVIRTFVIIFGTIWLVMLALVGVIELLVWLVIPLAPIVGAIAMIIGWTPS